MKSKLESLLSQLKNAYARFKEVMEKEKTDIVRDSAIQRFEFTFELAWKTMKAYVEEKGARVLFPKDAIKEAFRARIISDGDGWLDMLETRNMTSHIYGEVMAEKVYTRLKNYLPLIESLIKELS